MARSATPPLSPVAANSARSLSERRSATHQGKDRGEHECPTGAAVGAVCHGPAGLLSAVETDGQPLVAGKAMTAFTDAEERATGLIEAVPFRLETRLRKLGALFENGAPFAPYAIADGRLVTGQNPASSETTAKLILGAVDAAATVW